MDNVARSNRGQPTQLIHAKAQQRVRPQGACLDSQPHRDRRRVPAGGGESFEWRPLCGGFVKMMRLRVELRSKALDVFARDQLFRALKAHPDMEIIEPLNHLYAPLPWIVKQHPKHSTPAADFREVRFFS